MFDLSFWELAVILIVAVIIVGPERLPSLAYKAGQWVTKVRRFVANAKAEMESEFNTGELRKLLNTQEEEMQKLRQLVEQTRQDVVQEHSLLVKAMDENLRPLEEAAEPSAKPAPGTEPASKAQALPTGPRTIEDDMRALSEELGETFQRPNFGGESEARAPQSTPSTAKNA